MTLDLTDDEKAALVAHLRHALEYDRYPFAPRRGETMEKLYGREPETIKVKRLAV